MMSYSKPLIGLSDSKFDADLHKSEIDHDFFDNPCAGANLFDVGASSNRDNKFAVTINSMDNRSQSGELLKPIDHLPKVSINNETPEQNGLQPTDMAANSHGQFCLSFKSFNPKVDELVTPDTCVSSPNAEFPSNNQQIFSTGKLLECLQQSNESDTSGPHSSYFDQYFPKCQTSEGSSGESGIMTQDASAAHELETEIPIRRKLFDLSSSSSSGSNSECGSVDSLDTEEEEFVKLLGKYYDYLGESDFSDITEVSPMSSLTASPLPSLNGSNIVEESSLSADVDSVNVPIESGLIAEHRRRFPAGSQAQIYKPKPLPPLIIHTMEEIQPKNFQVGKSDGTVINGSSIPLAHSLASSLLMKVEQENDESIQSNPKYGSNGIQSTSNIATIFPACSSSEGSTSRVSFDSANSSSSSRIGSSISSSSLLSVGKKSAKNHSFTPDQLRRIERDNSNLLRRIFDASKSHTGHQKGSIHHHRFGHLQPLKSSAAIARQRQQRRIDHENSILVRRLQNAKPSKEIVDAFQATRSTNNVKCT